MYRLLVEDLLGLRLEVDRVNGRRIERVSIFRVGGDAAGAAPADVASERR